MVTRNYWERLGKKLGIKLTPEIIGYRNIFKGTEALNIFRNIKEGQISKLQPRRLYHLWCKQYQDVYPFGEEVDILIDIYKHHASEKFRDLAARLLSLSMDKKAIQFFEHLLQTSLSSEERQWAARSISSSHMFPRLSGAQFDYLRQVALYDQDKKVRLRLLSNLLKHNHPRCKQLRESLIHNSDIDVRKVAVRCLQLDNPNEEDTLLQIAKNDPNCEVRKEGIERLLMESIIEPKYLVLALDILKEEPIGETRKDIIASIPNIGMMRSSYIDALKGIMCDYPKEYEKFKSVLKCISETDNSNDVRKKARFLLEWIESIEKAELGKIIR
jgi:hypothetical protein